MIESKISSTDLVKIIIFGFLQIPFIGFIGWGGVPVIILLIGFFLTKRDKQISTLQASVNWCKYYSYFTIFIMLGIAFYNAFIEPMYGTSGQEIFEFIVIPLLLLLLVPISYLFILELLYSRPIQKNATLIFASNKKKEELSILKTENMKSYSVADELLKWKELKDQGLISEKDFEDMKKKIIGS